jgi:hypothetical protein
MYALQSFGERHRSKKEQRDVLLATGHVKRLHFAELFGNLFCLGPRERKSLVTHCGKAQSTALLSHTPGKIP